MRYQYVRRMAAELDIGSARRPNVLLDKLDRVLEQNFASRDFDLPMMAEEMGISERQLQRKLKVLTGYTPSAYVRCYRLNQSLDHLKSGESVRQSAKAVGFSSQAYFASCFKVEFGTTPSKYRDIARRRR
jgi:AraC-like DNA-binding protein